MLTSSLVGNVIVYLCFLTFSSFSFSVRDLFQNRFLVRCVVTHICREMGLFTGANDVPVVKVFALHSSTSLVRYTKKLFRTNSWLTLCFTFPIRNSEIFIVTNFLQGSVLSQHVQSTPLFIRHRSECFLKLTPYRHLNNHYFSETGLNRNTWDHIHI